MITIVRNILISLDQARELGFSIFNIDTKELIEYDMEKFSSGKKIYKDYDDAIFHIRKMVEKLIDEYSPSTITVEGVQMQQNKAVFAKLSRLQGVLINCLKENNINYIVIPPVTWKSYLKISKGNKTDREIEKKNSIKFAKEKLGVDTDDDNISDAICMGYYTLNKYEKDELIGKNR